MVKGTLVITLCKQLDVYTNQVLQPKAKHTKGHIMHLLYRSLKLGLL